MKLRLIKLLVMACLLLEVGIANRAFALTPEEEATATKLMKDGIAARDRGDLEGAEKAFASAHAIANLPSSGYALAKVYEKRGKLLLALQVARGVTRMTSAPEWTSASVEGFTSSAALVSDLEPRVPSIVVEVAGHDDATAAVDLDGERMKPPVLRVPRKVDPGHHRITVTVAGAPAKTEEIDLAEREEKHVQVALPPSAGIPPKAVPPKDQPPAPHPPAPGPSGTRPLLITGIATLGVGVASAGVGIVPAVLAKQKFDELEPHCPKGSCPPPYHDELKAAGNLALATNIAFIGGGVLAAAGLTMIIVDVKRAPSSSNATAPSAGLRLGPAYAGLDVRF